MATHPTQSAHVRAARSALMLAALAACIVGFCPAACSENPPPPGASSQRAARPLRIVSTIPPIRGLVDPLLAMSGAKYELLTLLSPGASEHGFEMTPASMEALARADVVVMVGLGMEPQVEKFLADHPSASRQVITLSDTVKSALVEAADAHDDHDHHDHGDHDHHHHGADPHIWLDPVLARSMVSECAAALKPLAPTASIEARKLDEARDAMVKRIDQVDADYTAAMKDVPRRTIVVAHDAYGYLARRYNLEVVSITGLSAGEPQPGDVKKAADAVMSRKLTTIFIEPQLSPAAAQRLAAATGAKTAILDPLGSGDWFALMNSNLAALKAALGTPIPPPLVDPASPATPATSPSPALPVNPRH